MPGRDLSPNTALIGIAGVHHVVSVLSRRGLVALPTIRNTAAYDIVVVTPDGRRHANLQVKTSSKKVTFFRMPSSKDVRSGRHDFYVLLRWDAKAAAYDTLMLTGVEARAAVRACEADQKKSIRRGTRTVLVPVLSITGRFADAAAGWRRCWQTWSL